MFTYYNNIREVLEMNVYTTEKIRNVVLLGHSGWWQDITRGSYGISGRTDYQNGHCSGWQHYQRF
jgi:hypothetical protein